MALQDDVQAILDGGVERGDVAGAVAGIVSADEVLSSAAAGVRAVDDETAAPMTTDTVRWIASMSKAGTYISQQFPFGDPRTFGLFDSIERACYAALG